MQSTASGTSSTQNTAKVGGVPITVDFTKQGKQCVTLKSLQNAARPKAAMGHAQSKNLESI